MLIFQFQFIFFTEYTHVSLQKYGKPEGWPSASVRREWVTNNAFSFVGGGVGNIAINRKSSKTPRKTLFFVYSATTYDFSNERGAFGARLFIQKICACHEVALPLQEIYWVEAAVGASKLFGCRSDFSIRKSLWGL